MSTVSDSPSASPPDSPRLPLSVTPSHYRVRLELDHRTDVFRGTVQITTHAAEAVSQIVLNGHQLTILAATVGGRDAATTVDADRQRITLDPGAPVGPGEVVISIDYEGCYDDQLVGVYKSRFTGADGTDHTLVATQFEATHARQCFPCWDEPAYKATFGLELVIDAAHEAVANTAEIGRETLDNGRHLVQFADTITMSTYLVAFVTGPLDVTEPVDVDGVALRVVSVPGKLDLAPFALESGAFALRYFADYFDVPYPGDKCDLVAIPDFAFGAMENLGCITFRETLLLVDPARATPPELQRVADVIHHELAHMWFGDLVTMAWWNGLWLNEAFATFMEMKCTDAFRPEWRRWVDFAVSRTAAFDTDALASTRPIEFEVVSPADAEGMFDILTYEKGAAIVRMLEQYLGEDRFQAGIRRYIRAHAYGNAETGDLWDAIEAEVGEPVRELMDSWIFQGGHPLVTAGVTADGLRLHQDRFRFVGGDESAEQSWLIPVTYRSQPADGDPVSGRIMLGVEAVTVPLAPNARWAVVNVDGAGFYRVAWAADQLDVLADNALAALTPTERYGLIDDAWAATLGDRLTAGGFLSVLEALSVDDDRTVWQRIIAGFEALNRLVDGEPREALQGVIHDAVAPALAGLGLSPLPVDDDRTRQLRGDLIRAMGILADDLEIQEESRRTVAEGRRNPELVEASIMAAAVGVVAAFGDEADFDGFLELHRTATTPQEEVRYLMALADFDDIELLERVFELILAGEVRTQNAPFWIARALTNRTCGAATWAWVRENWATLNERFPTASIVRMVDGVSTLTGPDQVADVAEFFARNPVPQGATTLAQILERQRVRAALVVRESERFARLLV